MTSPRAASAPAASAASTGTNGLLRFAFFCWSANLSYPRAAGNGRCWLTKTMLRLTAIALLAAAAVNVKPPSAREMYNEGLDKLKDAKLAEAEEAFRRASATNHQDVQPVATYNLGHVRFLQGKESLTGSGNRERIFDGGEAAIALAEEALRK